MVQADSRRVASPAARRGAALLLPERSVGPEKINALGPALKRGEGPRRPRCGWERSLWPHIQDTKLAEVSLAFPISTKQPQRVLIQDAGPRTPSAGSRDASAGSILHRVASMPPSVASMPPSIQIIQTEGTCDRAASHQSIGSHGGSSRGLLGAGLDAPSGSRSCTIPHVSDDKVSDFDMLSAVNKSLEETSSLSGFGWGKKRPRGCPLNAGITFGPRDNKDVCIDSSSVNLPTPGSILLQFTEPTHGTFRSALKPRPDVFRSTGEWCTGRPMCKGQIRTYIPPLSPPLARHQTPEKQASREHSPSPPVSELMRNISSQERSTKLSQSTTSFGVLSSRPCTSTDRPWTSIDSAASDDQPSMKVPEYFLPFISPIELVDRRPTPKVDVDVPLPPQPSLSRQCAGSLSHPSLGLYREHKDALIGDLKDLRRAGLPPLTDVSEQSPANPDGLPMMDLCICELHDTPADRKSVV